MIAALIIAFREGLEAALIIGIVFGYLKKTGQNSHRRQAWIGVLSAIVVCIAVAVGLQIIGAELEGPAEPIFEGTTMFLAVAIITWMVFWMRYQSRTLKSTLERDLQQAIGAGQGRGLMAVTFLAVFREGVELALFLSAAAFATSKADTLVGGLVGIGIAALVGYLIYASVARLNLRLFFNVTSILLLVFAAGLLSLGIHEFQEVGLLPMVVEHLWNTNYLLDETSTLGELLKAIVGYNGSPSLLQVVGYLAYWGFALFGIRWFVERKVARVTSAQLPAQA
jgi:high-affinity iron transporter